MKDNRPNRLPRESYSAAHRHVYQCVLKSQYNATILKDGFHCYCLMNLSDLWKLACNNFQ
jgi:hypothetical protein